MRIPRWTTYPALVALIAMLVFAIPHSTRDPHQGAAAEARGDRSTAALPAPAPARPRPVAVPAPVHERVVVLGIDGMDPDLLRETMEKFPERMRNFQRLADEGGVHELGTSTPPQSPVAWSNFITGLDPGGHGIFDFIHRDPMHRSVLASTTRSEESEDYELWGDWKFPLGGASESNRTGEAFWTILAEHGVPADIWRMPANFPVEKADGVSFSGMMTPALDSAYGAFTFYATDPPTNAFSVGKKIEPVTIFNDRIRTKLVGPPNAFKHEPPESSVPLTIYIDYENGGAVVDTGAGRVVLAPGEWSDFVPVTFSLLPAGMSDVHGLVRFYLRAIAPEFEMYASPVNIDPTHPVAPVSEPSSASAELADRAQGIGPYYTQGMPEDVNALKAEILTVPEFMQQAGLVHDEGVRMLDYALDRYLVKRGGGLLFFYFSTVDLCSHMMWRHHDVAHPHHDAALAAQDSSQWSHRAGSTWKDVEYDLYMHMDTVLGQLRERLPSDATVIVMSDHGFAPYTRKFSLNTWLLENGYLVLKPGLAKELPDDDPERKSVFLSGAVDWTKTRAYGVGFNALYLNLAGREQDDPKTPESESGIVQPGAEADALALELKQKLEALRDPKDNARVVLRCDVAKTVYHGERTAEAPDLIVGYDSGYDNSDESTTGRIPHDVFADNLGGTFNGSHLMAPEVVPGLLMTNRKVRTGLHKLEDLTVELLARYGVTPPSGLAGKRVLE